MLSKLYNQVVTFEPINELELIYLPLFKSNIYSPTELLREGLTLLKLARYDDIMLQKIAALMLLNANKIVVGEELDKIWDEVCNMKLKIVEYAENKGIEKGYESVTLKMLKKGKPISEISEFTGFSDFKVKSIATQYDLEVRDDIPAFVGGSRNVKPKDVGVKTLNGFQSKVQPT
ncbi:hypothetical protein AGMMS49975_29700 [Clostridia bacterium]|nr:hypothetical protein AGMMS49975_29700 [Clostridia bacterium]